MSIVHVVPKADWEVLKKYSLTGEGSFKNEIVVLIPEDVAKKTKTLNLNGKEVDYDCGSDADIWVEVVDREGHYFFEEYRQKDK